MAEEKLKSAKVTNLSFFLALGVVWAHSRITGGYELPIYYHLLSYTNFLGEEVVATFFFISGYLFFRTFSMEKYLDKLKSRVKTLIVPFLLWNCVCALEWYLVIYCSGHSYISDNPHFDGVLDIVGNIVSAKYSILWYVGVIILYAVLSPLFYYMLRNKRIGYFFLLLFCVVGVAFHHPYCSPLFWLAIYGMGAWMGLHCKDFMFKPQPKVVTVVCCSLFPVLFVLRHVHESMLTANLCQWVAVFALIGYYDLLDKCFHLRSHSIYKYSFFLYATHYIPLHFCARYVMNNWHSPAAFWVAYIIVPIAVTLVCVYTAKLLDKRAHPIYALLTGDR